SFRQPAHPSQNGVLMTEKIMSLRRRCPSARISLRRIDVLASARSRVVPFRLDEIEAALNSAPPAAEQRAEESQRTERGEVDAGHHADYRAKTTAAPSTSCRTLAQRPIRPSSPR